MKKETDITKIIMNPIRMRIIQFLIIHKTGTTIEIKENMTDVPPASLYRHIKTLLEAELIEIVQEKKNRGTMEKTYALRSNPVGEYSVAKVKQIINTALLGLIGEFNCYFEKAESDPIADMLTLSTSTLLLTDAEFENLLTKIGETISQVLDNTPSKERRTRRITFISSPSQKA